MAVKEAEEDDALDDKENNPGLNEIDPFLEKQKDSSKPRIHRFKKQKVYV